MPTIRVIGPGRAGRSLSSALADAGWNVLGPLGRGEPVADAGEGVDAVVVATPDDAIAAVAASIGVRSEVAVVHLSGSLGLDVLAPHPRRGALHPLVALPDARTGARRLASGITFAVAGDPIARQMATALGGRAVEVPDEARGAYHAAASVAANHVVALLGQVERIARSVGLPPDMFLPLARAAVEDVTRVGARRALTGPAARGDWQTLTRHLEALAPEEAAGYRAGVGLALQLTVGAATGEATGEAPGAVGTVPSGRRPLAAGTEGVAGPGPGRRPDEAFQPGGGLLAGEPVVPSGAR